MYNYFINFQPLLPDAPLQLGALRARLVHLWVNLALGQFNTCMLSLLLMHLGGFVQQSVVWLDAYFIVRLVLQLFSKRHQVPCLL